MTKQEAAGRRFEFRSFQLPPFGPDGKPIGEGMYVWQPMAFDENGDSEVLDAETIGLMLVEGIAREIAAS